jgi:hypothetical protein
MQQPVKIEIQMDPSVYHLLELISTVQGITVETFLEGAIARESLRIIAADRTLAEVPCRN